MASNAHLPDWKNVANDSVFFFSWETAEDRIKSKSIGYVLRGTQKFSSRFWFCFQAS